MSDVAFGRTNSRTLLGTLNDFSFMARAHFITARQATLEDIARDLAARLSCRSRARVRSISHGSSSVWTDAGRTLLFSKARKMMRSAAALRAGQGRDPARNPLTLLRKPLSPITLESTSLIVPSRTNASAQRLDSAPRHWRRPVDLRSAEPRTISLQVKYGRLYWLHTCGTVGETVPAWRDGLLQSPEARGSGCRTYPTSLSSRRRTGS